MEDQEAFVVVRRGPGVELQHGRYRNLQFAKHAHDDYSVSVNYNGVESIWLDGKTYSAVPGQITAYNPGEVQSGFSSEKEGWEIRALHLDVDWVARVLGEAAEAPRGYPIVRRAVIDDRQIMRLIGSLALDPAPLDPFDPRLVELTGCLFERHGEAASSAARDPASPGLRRAISYIHDHLAETVSLATLSTVSGLSPYYLTRACRAHTGFPPHQLQLQLRVQRARRMLARGKAISDVAYALGFADQSHMHRLFQRSFGMTPGQYRAGSARG